MATLHREETRLSLVLGNNVDIDSQLTSSAQKIITDDFIANNRGRFECNMRIKRLVVINDLGVTLMKGESHQH